MSWLFSAGPKYWSFSMSPSNEYSGLISFRIDCFDLLSVQGTLKSLLQDHSSKVSVLQCSDFFMVQLLHPYNTTEKTITLTVRTFVVKMMPLLFNRLSRFVISFLPRSKCLLISRLLSPFTVIRYNMHIQILPSMVLSKRCGLLERLSKMKRFVN